MELFNVVTLDEAKKIIDDNFEFDTVCEKVSITDCVERIVYKDILSCENVPAFARSTVDGYAVCSRDVFGASESIPALLHLKGDVEMGKAPLESIDLPGDCFYVPTGGMMPEGADAMVMIEYTEKMDEETVLVTSPVAPGDNIIGMGEDVKSGEVIIKSGSKLRPYEIGVLSSLGIRNVDVCKKVKVGIISTGDEIVGIEEIPGLGQVRDINTYLLYSSILRDGGVPVIYGLVKDEYVLLKSIVGKALSECDIVLISGGSSVGKKDQTLRVMNSYGEPGVLVHGISVKPGKPTIIGKVHDKAIFGLPGHPLACAVMYRIIVKYHMDKITGYNDITFAVACKFNINYHKAKGREEYLPVVLKQEGCEIAAEPVFGKSGLITGFSKAWGYIRIDRNIEGLKQGQIVGVYNL